MDHCEQTFKIIYLFIYGLIVALSEKVDRAF